MSSRVPCLGHDSDGSCWCDPQILQVCPECEEHDKAPSCWRCGGRGLVPEYDEDLPCIIVHRATVEQ